MSADGGRRERSFRQLGWFFRRADEVEIFDNCGTEPRLVVRKSEIEITVCGRPIQELLSALETAHPRTMGKLGTEGVR